MTSTMFRPEWEAQSTSTQKSSSTSRTPHPNTYLFPPFESTSCPTSMAANVPCIIGVKEVNESIGLQVLSSLSIAVMKKMDFRSSKKKPFITRKKTCPSPRSPISPSLRKLIFYYSKPTVCISYQGISTSVLVLFRRCGYCEVDLLIQVLKVSGFSVNESCQINALRRVCNGTQIRYAITNLQAITHPQAITNRQSPTSNASIHILAVRNLDQGGSEWRLGRLNGSLWQIPRVTKGEAYSEMDRI